MWMWGLPHTKDPPEDPIPSKRACSRHKKAYLFPPGFGMGRHSDHWPHLGLRLKVTVCGWSKNLQVRN